ncbi:MAG: PhzF family phenazine biosynthesis protein [Ruminococcaceae bacterium]|nr:PhzF family phenazine biosynthesis protein [Oscillospiraceae bacterium]
MNFYIVDCFTEEKYQGNQLLVILADRFISDDEQQKIAKEINFSETVFIFFEKSGYNLRIWTPNVGEVPFAGHPVLGAAFVIHNFVENQPSRQIELNLKVGKIHVEVSETTYTIKQNPPIFGITLRKEEIADIYGIFPEDIVDEYPIEWVSTGLEAVIIPLKSTNVLERIKVNPEKFKSYIKIHPECNCNHLFFVNTGSNSFQARCLMEDFVEDPATGSANGCMAAYIIKHNYFNSKKVSYTVYQGEDMGRKSVLKIDAACENNNWDIRVGGKCQLVAKGNWT